MGAVQLPAGEGGGLTPQGHSATSFIRGAHFQGGDVMSFRQCIREEDQYLDSPPPSPSHPVSIKRYFVSPSKIKWFLSDPRIGKRSDEERGEMTPLPKFGTRRGALAEDGRWSGGGNEQNSSHKRCQPPRPPKRKGRRTGLFRLALRCRATQDAGRGGRAGGRAQRVPRCGKESKDPTN